MINRTQPSYPALPNPAFDPVALWNFAYDFDSVSRQLSLKSSEGNLKTDKPFGTGAVLNGLSSIDRYVLKPANGADLFGASNFSAFLTFELLALRGFGILLRRLDATVSTWDWWLNCVHELNIAQFGVAVGSTQYYVNVSNTFQLNTVYSVMGVRLGTTLTVYLYNHSTKNILTASTTNAGITTVNTNASQKLRIGEIDSASSTYNHNLIAYNAALFKRALFDFEAKSLLENPWQLFKPRVKKTVSTLILPGENIIITPGNIYLTSPQISVNQPVTLAITAGNIYLTWMALWEVNQIDSELPAPPPEEVPIGLSEKLRIVSFNEIDDCTLTANLAAGSLVAANLQNDIKSKVWRSTGKTATFTATWADWKTIGMVAFPFCNFSKTATIRVKCFNNQGDPFPVLDSGAMYACNYSDSSAFGWDKITPGVSNFGYGGAVYAAIWFNQVTIKHMTVDIIDSLNTNAYIEAGRMVAGKVWSPVLNADYGLQINWKDASKNSRNDAGDLLTDIMPRSKVISLDFGMIDPRDRAKIMQNIRINGLSRPLFIAVFPEDADTDKAQDYMIYGKLSTLDAITLPNAAYYSSGLTIEEI